MKQPVKRRLSAIFAADVAGYSRLMGTDEEGTHQRFKEYRRSLIDPKIREHHGRVFKTTGDGVLVEFPSVVDAVRCAVEVQRAMIDRNAETPEDRRIALRIGVNLGDVIVDGGDIYGDGVNIAARLQTLADPGGVCITRVVRDQIHDKLSYAFEDLGEERLKNIARPVHVYAMNTAAVSATPLVPPLQSGFAERRFGVFQAILAAGVVGMLCAGYAAWRIWPDQNSPAVTVEEGVAATPQIQRAARLSIVVLPFQNLSNDPEQEYFADAITDDLTTDLSRIAGSFVIAPTTAFTYKGKNIGAKQIGRELGVRYLLDGSVWHIGDHIQVNVQLTDTESGAQLWAERFESNHANFAKAQKEITGRLARTLNLELAEAVGRRAERDGSVNPDAQDFLMRGWAAYYRPASAAVRQEALRAFERALELDPTSAEARIGIGTVLVDDLALRFSGSRDRDKARADQLLREALEHEINSSMARFAVGVLRRLQNRLNDSRLELETAIALDRNNARAFQQLGLTLMWLGQPEAAISQIERAILLNPQDPNISSYYWALGASKLIAGQVEDAKNLLTKARAANPRLFFVHLWLAAPLALSGDLDEAKIALAESMRLKADINSIAAWRAESPWYTNPQFTARAEKTLYTGLRRAGFPEE
jgi:adenylate cyclase